MNIQIELMNQAMTLSTPVTNALVEEFDDGMMIHGDNFYYEFKTSDVEKRDDYEDRTIFNLATDKITVTIHYEPEQRTQRRKGEYAAY